MAYFFSRLNAPRPTLAHDMTAAAAAKGCAVVVGRVLDPKGAWGLGILRAETEVEARTLIEADPILGADLGFSYEMSPMPRTFLRGLTADVPTHSRR